jgi:hypothetical protein
MHRGRIIPEYTAQQGPQPHTCHTTKARGTHLGAEIGATYHHRGKSFQLDIHVQRLTHLHTPLALCTVLHEHNHSGQQVATFQADAQDRIVAPRLCSAGPATDMYQSSAAAPQRVPLL